jgi:hypothetical protein
MPCDLPLAPWAAATGGVRLRWLAGRVPLVHRRLTHGRRRRARSAGWRCSDCELLARGRTGRDTAAAGLPRAVFARAVLTPATPPGNCARGTPTPSQCAAPRGCATHPRTCTHPPQLPTPTSSLATWQAARCAAPSQLTAASQHAFPLHSTAGGRPQQRGRRGRRRRQGQGRQARAARAGRAVGAARGGGCGWQGQEGRQGAGRGPRPRPRPRPGRQALRGDPRRWRRPRAWGAHV